MFKFIRSKIFDKAINSSKYKSGCSNLVEICKATILDMDIDCCNCNRYECPHNFKHIKTITICGDPEYQDHINTIEYILACRGYIVFRDINDIIITDNYAKYHHEDDYSFRFTKQKINISDAIMVVNVSKDLSVRVQCEIDHAINNGKKVYYMYNYNEELSDIP